MASAARLCGRLQLGHQLVGEALERLWVRAEREEDDVANTRRNEILHVGSKCGGIGGNRSRRKGRFLDLARVAADIAADLVEAGG